MENIEPELVKTLTNSIDELLGSYDLLDEKVDEVLEILKTRKFDSTLPDYSFREVLAMILPHAKKSGYTQEELAELSDYLTHEDLNDYLIARGWAIDREAAVGQRFVVSTPFGLTEGFLTNRKFVNKSGHPVDQTRLGFRGVEKILDDVTNRTFLGTIAPATTKG